MRLKTRKEKDLEDARVNDAAIARIEGRPWHQQCATQHVPDPSGQATYDPDDQGGPITVTSR
ncbi:MAG TPA: hypothetical protein VFL98_01665 [Candidatus Paceibacterota bacterium]|nr:hypothetical protein [Candidatus Paceibacterota bacterium]